MSNDSANARDDLAFMRSLVERDGRRTQATVGRTFLVGGLIYGAQCFVQWAGIVGYLPGPWVLNFWVGVGPTVLAVAVISWMAFRSRGAPQTTVQRALNAIFSATGPANLAMVAVFGIVAMRRHDWTIWELYACVVFAFQGLGWLAMFALQRRIGALVVALGWFASAIGLSLLLGTANYVLLAGAALILLLALPGYIMLRAAQREA